MRQKSTAVLVDGMARSGTSALMHTLEILGVDIGKHLIPPRKGVNELGFFEDQRIWRINNQIRNYLKANWNFPKIPSDHIINHFKKLNPNKRAIIFKEIDLILATKSSYPLWGFKSPGLSELFPIWIPEIEKHSNIKIVISSRHPADCAESMYKFSQGYKTYLTCLQLWLRYTLSIESMSRSMPRTFVRYEDLMNETALVVRQLINFLGIDVDYNEKLKSVNSFLRPGLRHENVDNKDNWGNQRDIDDIYQTCLEVYEIINSTAISLQGRNRLDQIQKTY